MILNLYKTNDSDNVINKTITNKLAININLKRDVDIISPRLVIRDSASININAFNYCQIQELDRFYFIRSINNLGGNLWEVICECDVLETYKNDFLNNECEYKSSPKSGDYGTFDINSTIKDINIYKSNIILDNEDSITLTTVSI